MMIKSKAAWLLAVAVSALVPTTRVFAYAPPTRVSLIQQPPAVQKEKLPSRDLFAQNKPVLPNTPPPSESAGDAMVWRVTWVSNQEKDYRDQRNKLQDEGWEPFAMSTTPVIYSNGSQYTYVYFGFRKKFPKSVAPN